MNLKSHLQSLKVVELREICKKSSIIGISGLKKSALIEMMLECELKETGFNPIINMSDIVPPTILEDVAPLKVDDVCICDELGCDKCDDEEEIILHLPIPRLELESVKIKSNLLKKKSTNYDKAYNKGKLILEKLKC